MRKNLLCIATVVAIVCSAAAVQAASTLAYGFEDPAFDGFFGLGAAVTQDTIGATQGRTRSSTPSAAAGSSAHGPKR